MNDFRILSTAFLDNVALAIVLVYAASRVLRHVPAHRAALRQALHGLLFSAMAVACLELPIELEPGVLVDQRSLILLFAAPMGGTWAALAAGAVAAAYRLHLGGLGAAAGVGAIVTATFLGIVLARWFGGLEGAKRALLGGFALWLTGMPWFLAIGGVAHGWMLLQQIAPTYLVFYVGGALVISGLFTTELRRQRHERELAENERRYRDVSEVSSDWIWETDADMRFTFISEQVRDVMGLEPQQFIGQRRSDVIGGMDAEAYRKHENIAERREAFSDFRFQTVDSAGCVRHISVSGRPMFDALGNFAGYRGSSRDITEQIEAKERLRKAMTDAEEANRAKTQFLSSMSHELRTPLNAIIGFSDMMRMEIKGPLGDDSYSGYAHDIHQSGEHLLTLLNDLLDLSKIEAGMLSLSPGECDLGETVGSVLRLLEPRALTAGVSLGFANSVEGECGLFDERAIRQLALNLVSNAVKYTPDGGQVNVTVSADGADGFLFEVQDTGIGISTEDQDRVFRPFEQAERDRFVHVEGTGLGLPICKALVEAHGGRIELNSQPGEGTVVRAYLPRAGMGAAQAPQKRAAA